MAGREGSRGWDAGRGRKPAGGAAGLGPERRQRGDTIAADWDLGGEEDSNAGSQRRGDRHFRQAEEAPGGWQAAEPRGGGYFRGDSVGRSGGASRSGGDRSWDRGRANPDTHPWDDGGVHARGGGGGGAWRAARERGPGPGPNPGYGPRSQGWERDGGGARPMAGNGGGGAGRLFDALRGEALYGVNPVLGALEAGRRDVHVLYVQDGASPTLSAPT